MTAPDAGGRLVEPVVVRDLLPLAGDELDWDVTKHGRMADHATEDTPTTEPYTGGEE